VKGMSAAAFDEQTRGYAASLRGTWVPADVYDLAVSQREACRERTRGGATQAVP